MPQTSFIASSLLMAIKPYFYSTSLPCFFVMKSMVTGWFIEVLCKYWIRRMSSVIVQIIVCLRYCNFTKFSETLNRIYYCILFYFDARCTFFIIFFSYFKFEAIIVMIVVIVGDGWWWCCSRKTSMFLFFTQVGEYLIKYQQNKCKMFSLC